MRQSPEWKKEQMKMITEKKNKRLLERKEYEKQEKQ